MTDGAGIVRSILTHAKKTTVHARAAGLDSTIDVLDYSYRCSRRFRGSPGNAIIVFELPSGP